MIAEDTDPIPSPEADLPLQEVLSYFVDPMRPRRYSQATHIGVRIEGCDRIRETPFSRAAEPNDRLAFQRIQEESMFTRAHMSIPASCAIDAAISNSSPDA